MNRIICTCFAGKIFQKNHEKCHDESTLDTQMSDVKPQIWRVKYHDQADYLLAADSGARFVSQQKTYLLKDNCLDAIQLPKTWDSLFQR